MVDNTVIEAHMDRVKVIAYMIAKRIPGYVDFEDFISVGYVGLCDAAQRYNDPNITFATFASYRIKGAIYDYLRSIDNVPRSYRKTMRQIEAEGMDLSDVSTISQKLGISKKKVLETLTACTFNKDVAIDDVEENCVIPSDYINQLDYYLALEQKELIAQALASMNFGRSKLSARAIRVMQMYYFQDMTMSNIAKEFGIAESRVSQLHQQALQHLRRKLER